MANSATMLVMLGSSSYLTSNNCQRERVAAHAHSLPLIRVHDGDRAKNGMPLPELRRVATAKLKRGDTEALFDDGEIIAWHRGTHFQQLALAAIAEQLLLASPMYSKRPGLPLYIRGTLPWAQPSFRKPVEIFTSVHNPRAAELVSSLLLPLFAEWRTGSLVRHASSKPAEDGPRVPPGQHGSSLGDGPTESDGSQVRRPPAWLIFLTPTCFADERGELLAAELQAALRSGVHLVLLYAPEEDAFDDVLAATPQDLVRAGLFRGLAIEWRSGAPQEVSVRLVAKALGAQLGYRADARESLLASQQWLLWHARDFCRACTRRRARTSGLGDGKRLQLVTSDRRSSHGSAIASHRISGQAPETSSEPGSSSYPVEQEMVVL